MSALSARRGFLRGLVSLPLVGGGVTLIGQPTAVAEPTTDALLDAYVALLAHEHRAALAERTIRQAERVVADGLAAGRTDGRPEWLDEVRGWATRDAPMYWFPDAPAVERVVTSAPPSSRAALVLSAVGHDWRRA